MPHHLAFIPSGGRPFSFGSGSAGLGGLLPNQQRAEEIDLAAHVTWNRLYCLSEAASVLGSAFAAGVSNSASFRCQEAEASGLFHAS